MWPLGQGEWTCEGGMTLVPPSQEMKPRRRRGGRAGKTWFGRGQWQTDRQLPNATEKSSKRETDILSLTLAMSKSWQNLVRETSIMERSRWQLWHWRMSQRWTGQEVCRWHEAKGSTARGDLGEALSKWEWLEHVVKAAGSTQWREK